MLFLARRCCGNSSTRRHYATLSQGHKIIPCIRQTSFAVEQSRSTKSHSHSNCVLFVNDIFLPGSNFFLRPEHAKHGAIFPQVLGRIFKSCDISSIVDEALAPVSDAEIEVIPCLVEGGALVKVQTLASLDASHVAERITAAFDRWGIRPWWKPLTTVQARVVHGRPWVQDLRFLPVKTLIVRCLQDNEQQPWTASVIAREQLYTKFREYGRILTLEALFNGSTNVASTFQIAYASKQAAIAACNCLHRSTLTVQQDGSESSIKMDVSYEVTRSRHWIYDTITNHLKISIPLLAALLTVCIVSVFDPALTSEFSIRTFFVKSAISGTLDISQYKLFRMIMATSRSRLFHRSTDMSVIIEEHVSEAKRLDQWLQDGSECLIVLQGPYGSGKVELLRNKVLIDRANTIFVDCGKVEQARSDKARLLALAKELGYWPVFAWFQTLAGLLDIAAEGMVGIKTGLSQTADTQITNVLDKAAIALQELSLSSHGADGADQGADEEYLEAHPDRWPVVVLDNFCFSGDGGAAPIMEKITKWASQLAAARIAHVIIVTSEHNLANTLEKVAPGTVIRQVYLGDITSASAKQFLASQLKSKFRASVEMDSGQSKVEIESLFTPELGSCLDMLGGRLTSIQHFARRITAGESPSAAVNEMINQIAESIVAKYIVGPVDGSQIRKWEAMHVWKLLKGLAATPFLLYDEVVYTEPFDQESAPAILHELVQNGLIMITSKNGRPDRIYPETPIQRFAFKLLTGDGVLEGRIGIAVVSEQLKNASSAISKAGEELRWMLDINLLPKEMLARKQYLLVKVANLQQFITEQETKLQQMVAFAVRPS